MPSGTLWTEPKLVRALSLYRQIPFGRMHRSAPEVILLAASLGRTPSSVAMKLSNFASFDPEHQDRGVGGLANASALDQHVWARYASDWSRLAHELELPDDLGSAGSRPEAATPNRSGAMASSLQADAPSNRSGEEASSLHSDRPTEADRLVAIRRGQNFFRRTVLSAYESRCCVTGLATPSLLRAGHIVPWNAREATRLDPHNGLCLNALHDAAFDRGLMTLDEDMRVVYAKSLWKDDHTPEAVAMLRQFEGIMCRPATRHTARGEYLEWHRESVFDRA